RSRLVRLALKPMKNAERDNVCVVVTELTELAEANEALRSNEESLRQLSARCETFVSGLSLSRSKSPLVYCRHAEDRPSTSVARKVPAQTPESCPSRKRNG